MTEDEWLTTTDSHAMLDHLATANPRKLRQFACECSLREWRGCGPSEVAAGVIAVMEVYRRYLDGEATPTEWFETYSGAGGSAPGSSLHDLIAPEPFEAARRAAGFSRSPLSRMIPGRRVFVGPVDRPEEAALLRDIFGNPFRPVAFAADWRTDTAVAIAREMYSSRDFGAMPILADALQDAGCDSADILSHCRSDGPHVRGCWVVDLVLGKE